MYQIWKLMLLVSLLICHLLSKVPGTSSEPPKHFVLVHGSCHGAWSWYKVVPLLKSGGHNVTALDLGGSGVDPQQVNTLRSISDYIKPLREFMASLPDEEKVVLVGHSLGGLAISQAMEMFPEKVAVAVFVTASMPGPTLNVSILIQKFVFVERHYVIKIPKWTTIIHTMMGLAALQPPSLLVQCSSLLKSTSSAHLRILHWQVC
ncbi:hypothetical protein ES332_D12G028100v1 [Gossypium tomentosum]|uniref:AB hydrolase-1 domain-containing protein n=1 Tax=Gossypium tomentosum TaxID=34277 RepID=A0A5D2I3X2_GOSTO|nr:hypothetical protein ES332_D12G028100v1 [Gossypium tomentosum]